jgi:nicotinamidase-related amidase
VNGRKSRIEAADCIVLFADLQAGIAELTKTNPLERLRSRVQALAELAMLFEIPVVITGIRAEDGTDAKILPEIGAALGAVPTYHRPVCDAFLDDGVVSAIQKTGRKTILISGVATEVAVQLAALTATDEGYKTFLVLDACGGMSERTEQAALQRIAAAGASTVSVMTLAGELAGEFTRPKGQQAIGILYRMAAT